MKIIDTVVKLSTGCLMLRPPKSSQNPYHDVRDTRMRRSSTETPANAEIVLSRSERGNSKNLEIGAEEVT